jgi:hypothetical protein
MYRGFACVLLLTTCTLAGCGGDVDAGRKPVFPVTGTVTMYEAPLSEATVAFVPQDGQPTAVGKTDAEGKLTLTTYEYGDGAAAGTFRVVISKTIAGPPPGDIAAGDHEASEEAAGSHDAAAAEGGAGAEMVPPQYASSEDTPFTVEVKTSGENDFPLPIE